MSNIVKLLKKAKQDDDQAMMALIQQFNSLLIKLSKRYSSKIDEDCYQELSIQFVIAVKKFDLTKYKK